MLGDTSAEVGSKLVSPDTVLSAQPYLTYASEQVVNPNLQYLCIIPSWH